VKERAADRLAEILSELAGIGAVLPGSISERWTCCQSAGCRCRSDPPVLHGPYPTWTWKPAGVSVTKTITIEQAGRLQPYSQAHHRLKELVAELERVSLELIEQEESVDLRGGRQAGRRSRTSK
jgi:hypothetical protein